ncbi:divergent polysaccharide deacetylase family protein [Actinobacillus indolicus]|uniref:Divergent polysaccharide deacetylase family protein n=1 Tax=Actinobacillus indolicus TaxID=51049 RepID=A0A4P7CMD6_9PAST|nr:divergent polysaccharide deacetylase family protein [Actinobacillus indolicus]QBQ64719.1 divergent polysaccharide deacetylase family protein [Actinobacillus indolicus]
MMNKWRNKRSIPWLFLQILWLISPLAEAGKLAIVIDDIGYRAKEDSAIYALPKEVSVAIIPVAPYATARANKAFEQQRDVLIHLPMEPQTRQSIEAGALLVGMNETQIATLIKNAQMQVPNAIGLNNHMGSKATTDKQTMQYLMKSLSQQNLAFLDSKTAGNSVAYKTAKEYGIKALERHIFLDDSDEFNDVQRQFSNAIHYARKHGVAVMIGHPRKNSVEVLENGIANLPADIQLVSLHELWNGDESEPVKPFIMLFDIEPALTSKAPYQVVPLLRGVPKD